MTNRVIAVTGPRNLSRDESALVRVELAAVMESKGECQARLMVGDADGVDAVARSLVYLCFGWALFEAEGRQPWQLQRRSKNMIDSLSMSGGELHAWPNKLCPQGLTVDCWQGSGTWGTMRYAVSLGVPVVVHTELMPGGYELPSWLDAGNQTALDLADELIAACQ